MEHDQIRVLDKEVSIQVSTQSVDSPLSPQTVIILGNNILGLP